MSMFTLGSTILYRRVWACHLLVNALSFQVIFKVEIGKFSSSITLEDYYFRVELIFNKPLETKKCIIKIYFDFLRVEPSKYIAIIDEYHIKPKARGIENG